MVVKIESIRLSVFVSGEWENIRKEIYPYFCDCINDDMIHNVWIT